MTLAGKMSWYLVPKSKLLYRISKNYIDKYNGDNNGDISINGELLFLRKYLKDLKVVFDVGANVGEWTLLALSINPNLEIHCFEPSRATFEVLKRKVLSSNVI